MKLAPHRLWATVAIVFVASAALGRLAFSRFPALFDVDSYFHLAVARAYAERGFFQTLDWARFSVMHDGFGDKEFLFHVLLRPFATAGDATAGGFTALACLDALVAAVLAHAAITAIGPWGVTIPLLVFGGSMDFTSRMVRLRPEIVSLVLILLAITVASRRRWALLGVVACIFTLTYTPFHALLGLCVLFFARVWWVEGRAEWGLIVSPALGIALGLLVHPHFPSNLRIWWVQNVVFFLHKASFDVSAENAPRTTTDLLLLNLGWLAGLLVLWRSRAQTFAPTDTRRRDFTTIATVVFAGLYVVSARFVTYFVPLATLTVLRVMQAAGQTPGRFVRLAGRQVPFAVAFGTCLLWGVYAVPTVFRLMQAVTPTAFRPEARADWERFGRAMPRGAKVFASWQAAEAFVFWAPQALYVNLLDSVFMLAKDAERYAAYMDILQGHEPDIPLVATSRFDSDFFADDGQSPLPRARLAADPRVTRLHDGITSLYGFGEPRDATFLLDWKVLPENGPAPPALDRILDPSTPTYPRARNERERAREGYVDGRRVASPKDCMTFVRVEDVERPTRFQLEVAPYGSADIFVDDGLVATIPSPRLAVIGNGVIVPVAFAPGRHRLTVRTCPSGSHVGFYALVRP